MHHNYLSYSSFVHGIIATVIGILIAAGRGIFTVPSSVIYPNNPLSSFLGATLQDSRAIGVFCFLRFLAARCILEQL
jgi:hypothetical protein